MMAATHVRGGDIPGILRRSLAGTGDNWIASIRLVLLQEPSWLSADPREF